MKKQIFLLLLIVTLTFFLNPHPAHAADIMADLNLSTAYRVDDLNWSIAGSNNNPNVLSELTWSDLEMVQATLSGRVLVNEWLYLRGSFGYGYTFSGDNQDSDYAGNDRTREFSRSSNSADCSRVLDAAMGLGYQFSFLSGRFRLSLLFGYSYNSQDLKLNDGFQVIATRLRCPPCGAAPDPLRQFQDQRVFHHRPFGTACNNRPAPAADCPRTGAG